MALPAISAAINFQKMGARAIAAPWTKMTLAAGGASGAIAKFNAQSINLKRELAGLSEKQGGVEENMKSLKTETGRITQQMHLFRKILTGIGVLGFTQLLMTAPQLAGAIAKIKYEAQRLAWDIGKHLKPALDSVATILRGIRTGDWSTVHEGAKRLYDWLVEIAGLGVDIVLKPVIGEEGAKTIKTDFNNWISNIKSSLEEGRGLDFVKIALYEPLKWVYDNGAAILGKIKDIMDTMTGFVFPGFRAGSPLDKFTRGMEDIDRWIGQTIYDYTGINIPIGQKIDTRQVGGMIGQTGLYMMHAGETVMMAGSSGMGDAGGLSNTINLDFSGANFVLNGGIELDQFAETLSNKIAERQSNLTY